jgi:hypothetical protein
MSDCVCLPKCLFFNDKMNEFPSTVNRMKERYCLGDSTHCARFMVFKKLGRDKVPLTLYPHQTEKAQEIIDSGG